MSPDYTFKIVSKKHGTFTVTAPLRFRTDIEQHKWHVHYNRKRASGKFAVATHIHGSGSGRTSITLHRFIWELAENPRSTSIDHIDRQPLNNSESNLRDGTHGNTRNAPRRRNNTSGAIGVSWHKSNKRWRAYVKVRGKIHHLGLFATAEEASAARDAAAIRLHGEFAVLNGGST